MTKEEIIRMAKQADSVIEQVIEIYEKHNGVPDEDVLIDCPRCEVPTLNYSCAWKNNNHVRFHCSNCSFGFMQ